MEAIASLHHKDEANSVFYMVIFNPCNFCSSTLAPCFAPSWIHLQLFKGRLFSTLEILPSLIRSLAKRAKIKQWRILPCIQYISTNNVWLDLLHDLTLCNHLWHTIQVHITQLKYKWFFYTCTLCITYIINFVFFALNYN